MTVKERYSGIQTVLKATGEEGCHFLTLLSIAEEHSGKPVDLIYAIRLSQSKGWITPDFWVKNDGTPLLKALTGIKCTRREVTSLPPLGARDYSEAVYYNPATKLHHYRRRGIDTLAYSNTVANGYIEKYYIYTFEK